MVAMTQPRQRADARRNRAELLRVGAQALAELGATAPTREIARRAGVAVGTFFRHFPTKDDLISAIMVDHYTRLKEITDDLEASVLTPRAALESYMERAAAQIAPDRAFFQVAHLAGANDESIREAALALDAGIGRLLTRAQESGAVRADLVANDIQTLVQAATGAVAPDYEQQPDRWRRYLALILDSLGSDSARTLPVGPLTFEDFPAMNEERKRKRMLGGA